MKRHRKRYGRLAVIALIGPAVGACAPRQDGAPEPVPEAEQALVARGAEVYGYSCGRCHNPRAAVERTDRSWETIVDHMRVRANLTGGEARAVTAFMRALNLAPADRVVYDTVVVMDTVVRIDSVFIVAERPAQPVARDTPRAAPRPVQRPEPPPSPVVDLGERVRRGQELVTSKGCIGCHVVAGRGGTVGPGLDAVFARRDSAYVRRKLRDPRFDNPNTVMPAFGLSDAELDAIAAYLRSLGR